MFFKSSNLQGCEGEQIDEVADPQRCFHDNQGDLVTIWGNGRLVYSWDSTYHDKKTRVILEPIHDRGTGIIVYEIRLKKIRKEMKLGYITFIVDKSDKPHGLRDWDLHKARIGEEKYLNEKLAKKYRKRVIKAVKRCSESRNFKFTFPSPHYRNSDVHTFKLPSYYQFGSSYTICQ